jgi:hypothetical protein
MLGKADRITNSLGDRSVVTIDDLSLSSKQKHFLVDGVV